MAQSVFKNAGSPKDWQETVSLFQEYLLAQDKAEETITAYGVDLKRFGKFYIDRLKKPGPHISRLKEGDLQAYIDYMASERYFASSAINRAIAALRLFSRYILENGWNRQNIAAGLRTYSLAPPAKPIELTPAEIRKLCSSAKTNSNNGERDYAIIQTLLQCGLRLDEICRLLIRDLKLIKETATEEGDIITVVNAAVAYLRAQSIELPAFTVISNVSAKALRIADENLMDRLGSALSQKTCKGLDALLKSKGTRTQFDKFKEDIGSAGPKEILKALGQLEQIGQYPLDAPVLRRLTRRKIDSFALLGWKTTLPSLAT